MPFSLSNVMKLKMSMFQVIYTKLCKTIKLTIFINNELPLINLQYINNLIDILLNFKLN